jgi:hypothetical protein
MLSKNEDYVRHEGKIADNMNVAVERMKGKENNT